MHREVLESELRHLSEWDEIHMCGDVIRANSLETAADSGTLNYVIADTDSDGIRNYIELDSDNDGIPDDNECTDIAKIIESNSSNLGQLNRKSWTLTDREESQNPNWAGSSFGALRSECTQLNYGQIFLQSCLGLICQLL